MTEPKESPRGLARAMDQAMGSVEKAVDQAVGGVGMIGRAVGTALRLPGLTSSAAARHAKAGQPAGIEHVEDVDVPPEPGHVRVTCIEYGRDRYEARAVGLEDIPSLKEPLSEGIRARWINVDGLHPFVIDRFRRVFGFHTLAAEDVLHVGQRPRVEPSSDHLFVVVRMMMLHDHALTAEQVSMFLYPGVLITFQERTGDVWDPIRTRLRTSGSRMQDSDADFLLYALLDAVVDHSFPLLERYGDVLETLEDEVMQEATPHALKRIQGVKRELSVLRRVLWPTRELVDQLRRDEADKLSPRAETYLGDVYTHTVQLIDVVETHREMAANLTDLYMSVVSNRMNEVMKVLTIMASLFIPVSFLAGVYGMNFEHIPELGWRWSYYGFWGVCAAVTLGLLFFFRRRGWL